MAQRKGETFFWYLNEWRGSAAVRAMTLAERGAFLELLSWVFSSGGAFPDDDEEIALRMGVRLLDWLFVKDVVRKEFSVLDGKLCHWKISEMLRFVDSQSAAARKRWGKSECQTNASRHVVRDVCELGTRKDERRTKKTTTTTSSRDDSSARTRAGGVGAADVVVENSPEESFSTEPTPLERLVDELGVNVHKAREAHQELGHTHDDVDAWLEYLAKKGARLARWGAVRHKHPRELEEPKEKTWDEHVQDFVNSRFGGNTNGVER